MVHGFNVDNTPGGRGKRGVDGNTSNKSGQEVAGGMLYLQIVFDGSCTDGGKVILDYFG